MTTATESADQQDVPSINPDAQHLLETYTGLEPDQVLPHVLAVVSSKHLDNLLNIYGATLLIQQKRNEASKTPSPLSLNVPQTPFYDRILSTLRCHPSANFLNAGCSTGQDLRLLSTQGIPPSQLYGCDIDQTSINTGYDLFLDKEKPHATFVQGDLLAPSDEYRQSNLVKTLQGKIDVVFAGSLFQLWDYEDQVLVATRLVDLCREKEGIMISGCQVGSLFGGRYPYRDVPSGSSDKMHYLHNLQTIQGLWYEVGQRSGTRWVVETGFCSCSCSCTPEKGIDANTRMIWWCATRERQ